MMQALQQQFTTLVERGAFEPVRRHLTSIDQDDRMAEAIGQVWAMSARKAELGIKLDNALLVHAVKLRAIDHRRQLPRGGQPRRDDLPLPPPAPEPGHGADQQRRRVHAQLPLAQAAHVGAHGY